MGAVVQFSYDLWILEYPVFAPTVSSARANTLFGIACSLHSNEATGPVTDPTLQLSLLNMVVAHLAALMPAAAGDPRGLVGRISSASEGAVSVSTDFKTDSAAQAFWAQTEYGAIYWQATVGFRQARYRPFYGRTGMVPPWA